MGIYMYDVKFGDCFQIKVHNDYGLVVDFGSMHNLDKQFIKIIKHFSCTSPKKILLSHYHMDHLSGLLFMMNNKGVHQYNFDEILLPDVFSGKGAASEIALLILDKCILPKHKKYGHYTLLELVKYLCRNSINIKFLSRGVAFDEYIALWPDKKRIKDDADKILDSLKLNYNDMIQKLLKIAERLREIVNLLTVESFGDRRTGVLEEIINIEEEINSIFVNDDLSKAISKLKLTEFGHSVNIVFQNKNDSDNNILFTGDIDKGSMGKIKKFNVSTPNLNLHEKYEYIKIPHHGTLNHFYDFKKYKPQKILIPNGKHRAKSYRITDKYYEKHQGISKFYCSNSNWCEQRECGSSKCCCNEKAVVFGMKGGRKLI